MASKNSINNMVIKILRAYPQIKITPDAIVGFVDLLAEKLKNYPDHLLDQVADVFMENEIDFPRFNVAAILSYCWNVRGEQIRFWSNRLQELKDDWNAGIVHDKKEWLEIVAGFRKLNAYEWAREVEARIEQYTKPITKPAPEKIEEVRKMINNLAGSMKVEK